MPSIEDLFKCEPDCSRCYGTGHVCENHPDLPWGDWAVMSYGIPFCRCGGAGMPCKEENRQAYPEVRAWSGR
jgi:hypothetical protein